MKPSFCKRHHMVKMHLGTRNHIRTIVAFNSFARFDSANERFYCFWIYCCPRQNRASFKPSRNCLSSFFGSMIIFAMTIADCLFVAFVLRLGAQSLMLNFSVIVRAFCGVISFSVIIPPILIHQFNLFTMSVVIRLASYRGFLAISQV